MDLVSVCYICYQHEVVEHARPATGNPKQNRIRKDRRLFGRRPESYFPQLPLSWSMVGTIVDDRTRRGKPQADVAPGRSGT